MAGKSRVTGAPETIKAMREVARYVAPAANSASKHSLEPTLDAAKEGAPVRTGTLRRSLTIKRDRESSKSKPRYFVGPDSKSPAVRYAHITEFGRMASGDKPALPGRRWMTAAFEVTKEEVARRFGVLIGPALEKQAARVAAQKAKRARR
jgi:HK97 gp10 family phage protein